MAGGLTANLGRWANWVKRGGCIAGVKVCKRKTLESPSLCRYGGFLEETGR